MSKYSLAYGNSSIEFDIPDSIHSEEISPELVKPSADPSELVRQAIASPIGVLDNKGFPLDQRLTAAIAINDKTRPVPHAYLLPPLLDYLQNSLGIKKIEYLLHYRFRHPFTNAPGRVPIFAPRKDYCRIPSHGPRLRRSGFINSYRKNLTKYSYTH